MTAGNDTLAQSASIMAKEPAAKEKAAANVLLPLPPREIVDTIKKLTTYPRVRYLSQNAQYNYYVGGLIDAEHYSIKNKLVVSNVAAEDSDTVTWEYSKDR